ncbi:hypothetical protein AB1484_22970 [Parafrankia sp. FMc6]|uniref:hypothetical protein n=1 Tax=Parafrankia soli TaxID=2599596 RepID=UPI0034D3FE2B
MSKHALPARTAGDDGNGRPWPKLPGDREPSPNSWTVILDGSQKKKDTGSKGGGR